MNNVYIAVADKKHLLISFFLVCDFQGYICFVLDYLRQK